MEVQVNANFLCSLLGQLMIDPVFYNHEDYDRRNLIRAVQYDFRRGHNQIILGTVATLPQEQQLYADIENFRRQNNLCTDVEFLNAIRVARTPAEFDELLNDRNYTRAHFLARDDVGNTALHLVLQNAESTVEMIEFVLHHGEFEYLLGGPENRRRRLCLSLIHTQNLAGYRPLQLAVERGRVEAIEPLLNANADINAASRGYTDERVAILFDHLANVQIAPPLQMAIVRALERQDHSTEMIRILIDHHVRCHPGDISLDMFLHLEQTNQEASRLVCGAILRTIVEEQIDVRQNGNRIDQDWHLLLLEKAAEFGDVDALNFLVPKGGLVGFFMDDRRWHKVLSKAAETNNVEVARFLVDHGVQVEQSLMDDGLGGKITPLHIAATLGHDDFLRFMLVDAPVAVRAQSLKVLNRLDAKVHTTPLFHAIDKGRLSTVACLLELGVSVDWCHLRTERRQSFPWMTCNRRGTPLHLAIIANHSVREELVRLLIETIVQRDQRQVLEQREETSDKTPLDVAIALPWVPQIPVALNGGANGHVNVRLGYHTRCLTTLAMQFLGLHPNMSLLNHNQDSVLHLAAQNGHVMMACFLSTQASAEVINMGNRDGDNFLQVAIKHGYPQLVRLFLDPHFEEYGNEEGGFRAIPVHVMPVEQLLRNDVRIDAVDADGKTFLHQLASIGNPESLTRILMDENFAHLHETIFELRNRQDRYGNTPLHCVANRCFNRIDIDGRRIDDRPFEVRRNNIADAIDLNAQNNDGKTLLHLCIEAGYLQTALSLIACERVHRTLQDIEGETVLHAAVRGIFRGDGQRELIESLIRHGADGNVRNRLGQTPYELAIALNYHRLAQFILREEARRQHNIHGFFHHPHNVQAPHPGPAAGHEMDEIDYEANDPHEKTGGPSNTGGKPGPTCGA